MHYDVIVIGAGIQGAGVAQAAAAAGHSVLILEKTDIASGTSSKSSKLIHGGLRYLESFQFNLVRESLAERAILLDIAPELVKLRSLHIPIYNSSSRSPFIIGVGLSLYRALSFLDKDTRFNTLDKKEWSNLGGLTTQGLKQVYRYCEAQTDDRALTQAVIHSACKLGAELIMPATFTNAEINDGGCSVTYQTNAGEQTVDCATLVNCAGPWANIINQSVNPTPQLPKVDLVQGSHLLLPPVLDQYFYLEAPVDQRAVFALPWKGKLLLGTTETVHTEAPELAHCHPHEMHYLLKVLKHYFPDIHVLPSEVESFAGLRVLPYDSKNPFTRSREVMLCKDNKQNPRVLTLMGGKLTTYRATAERALKAISPSLPERAPIADTKTLALQPVG